MSLSPYFLQYAQGAFNIEVTGPYHCGPNHDSPKRFQYEVTLHYPDSALDSTGFLQDNLGFLEYVKTYFASLQSTHLSCELLCRASAKDLCELSPDTCEGVKVAIWPIENTVKVEYLHPRR